MRFFIFSLLVVCLSFTCNEEKTYIFYTEPKCGAPWGQVDTGDAALMEAAEAWIDSMDLPDYCYLEIQFDEEFAQLCEACNCTTGRLIALELGPEHKEAYLDIGFQE
ncbi:MAG: hypothetical protein HKN16_01985 [Saprospiraceae bacterium]|nr:hypothetical protein [Saprospiraceae bacterium]